MFEQEKKDNRSDQEINEAVQNSSAYREAAKKYHLYGVTAFLKDIDRDGKLPELSKETGVSAEELTRYYHDNWPMMP